MILQIRWGGFFFIGAIRLMRKSSKKYFYLE